MTFEERNEYRRRIAEVIDNACRDESFKKRLIAEPKAVLEEHGISLPEDLKVEVLEQTDKRKYILVPYKPEDAVSGSWMCGDDNYDAPCVRCS